MVFAADLSHKNCIHDMMLHSNSYCRPCPIWPEMDSLGACPSLRRLCCPILGLCWPSLEAMLAHLGGYVGPCWGYVGPSWGYVGPSWGYVGPSWGYVGPSGTLFWDYERIEKVMFGKCV